MDQPQRPILALGLRLAAMVLVAVMFALGKRANETGVALPEILFWRQAVGLPMLLGYLAATGGLGSLHTRRVGSHALRACMGMVGMFCNFAAVTLLPLAVATTLSFAAPLFAVIIASLFLRDPVGRWRWTAVACGFAGVLVITHPGHADIPILGAIAGIVSALLVSIISFQIRGLMRTETPIAAVIYFSLFGTLLTGLVLPFFYAPHDFAQWMMLIGLGVAGTIAQLLLTMALRYGSVSSVIVMDYSQIIWATLFGWLIWGYFPEASTWVGMPLIVAAGLVIAWREHTLARDYGVTPAKND